MSSEHSGDRGETSTDQEHLTSVENLTPVPEHAKKEKHVWTKFEKHVLLCIIARGIHIPGVTIVTAEEYSTYDVNDSRRTHVRDVTPSSGGWNESEKQVRMDVAHAFNTATNKSRDYEKDIDQREVYAMMLTLLRENKAVLPYMERASNGHITKAMRQVWNRGLSKTALKDRKKGREQVNGKPAITDSCNNEDRDVWSRDTDTAAKDAWGDSLMSGTDSSGNNALWNDGFTTASLDNDSNAPPLQHYQLVANQQVDVNQNSREINDPWAIMANSQAYQITLASSGQRTSSSTGNSAVVVDPWAALPIREALEPAVDIWGDALPSAALPINNSGIFGAAHHVPRAEAIPNDRLWGTNSPALGFGSEEATMLAVHNNQEDKYMSGAEDDKTGN